jgi:hypothetical protein
MRPALAAAVGCCLLLSAGCAANLEVGNPAGSPDCPSAGGPVTDPLVLIAQSVPTAAWLPCLRALPVGWSYRHLEAQSGRSRAILSASDTKGDHQVDVILQPSCDVAGASEVNSGSPGLRRYDRQDGAAPGYHADRYYVFPGGCITHHFDLNGPVGAEAAIAVSAGLGFVSRDTVAAAVSKRSGGRLTLDPGGTR